MLPRNILSGFESTGTWPYNRDVFSEEDFAPAIATDRIFTPDNDIPPDNSISDLGVADLGEGVADLGDHLVFRYILPKHFCVDLVNKLLHLLHLLHSVSAITATTLEPGRASDSSHDEETQRTEMSITIKDLAPSTSQAYVSSRDVYSIPKAQPSKSKGSSRKGKTQILTATPVREKIALSQKQREAKRLPKTKKVKKNLFARNRCLHPKVLMKVKLIKLNMMMTLTVH